MAEIRWYKITAPGTHPKVWATIDRMFEIRSYEERYNLRRLIVAKGYRLYLNGSRMSEHELLRDAKTAAQVMQRGGDAL